MKQKFNFRPLPMLVAALTVADHFEAEKGIFVTENPQWADPFIGDFREAVSTVLQQQYGINPREGVLQQTRLVNELCEKAAEDLKMLKTQIERGFRTEPGKSQLILNRLGFGMYWSKAANNNQTMLISLLLALRNNLSAELRTELEQGGVNTARMDRLIAEADRLTKANITQESLKGSAKLDTEKVVQTLNDIYDRAMDICAIGQQLFRKDKLKKDLFVFSKLVKQQSTQANGGTTTNSAEDTPAAR